MRFIAVLLVIFTRIFCAENRRLTNNHVRNDQEYEPTFRYPIFDVAMPTEPTSEEIEEEGTKFITFKNTEDDGGRDDVKESYENNSKQLFEKLKEPCAIVVRSNIQNPTLQSLLRKYKYDARGILIPSSVKYFIKVPQGYGSPILVPLNDKSYSHLGGFVRYYKEVPPIPQAWCR